MLRKIALFVGLVFTPLTLLGQGAVEKFEPHLFKTKADYQLPYRVLKPAQIEPGKKYPLVLFLHGMGERGDNNTAQIRNGVERFADPEKQAKYPCFVIAPQCPVTDTWVFDASDKNTRNPQKPLNAAFATIDQFIKGNPVDKGRIYVIGLSMGGNGTFNALAARPKFFAAAVPICGWGDTAAARSYAKVPLWAFHGADDTTVRPKGSEDMVAALKKAGGKPKLTIFPGVKHDSWTPALQDTATWEWLFSQKN